MSATKSIATSAWRRQLAEWLRDGPDRGPAQGARAGAERRPRRQSTTRLAFPAALAAAFGSRTCNSGGRTWAASPILMAS